MSKITEQQVLEALKNVQDPDLRTDIVSLKFVRNVRICDGNVAFEINLTTPACPVKEKMKSEAEAFVKKIPGVQAVQVTMTSEVKNHGALDKTHLKGVKNVIAVGSGKGGVGKSTVSVNLAVALALEGAKVGLLDADIYGPSIPIMMGKPGDTSLKNGVIQPKEAHGVRFMSMGFFAHGDQPLIWRGPMAHRALEQCMTDVEWGGVDYMVVDLPPGTGDVHLTLIQTLSLAGAVLVSTPQDVGLTISMKTLRMFEQSKVPILGIIENMSYHFCSHCGAREEIFGHGGAQEAAKELEVPFLGEIPLDASIRLQSDRGVPVVLSDPDSAPAKTYRDIARRTAAQVSIVNQEV